MNNFFHDDYCGFLFSHTQDISGNQNGYRVSKRRYSYYLDLFTRNTSHLEQLQGCFVVSKGFNYGCIPVP